MWHELKDLAFFGLCTSWHELSQNEPELVTNVWFVSFLTFITRVITDHIAMWVIGHIIVDSAKTQTLLWNFKILWTLVFAWTVSPLSISGNCWSTPFFTKPTSARRPVARRTPSKTRQHQDEETRQPRWCWNIQCGSRQHKRKTFSRRSFCVTVEDNEAVIKMFFEVGSPTRRHVSRTHSCAWLVVWQNQCGPQNPN